MPRTSDFTATASGVVIRAAELDDYRALRARLVSLPRPMAVIGHSRLLAYVPVEAASVPVH